MSSMDLAGSISMRKRGMVARIDALKEEISRVNNATAEILAQAEGYLDQLDGDPAMLHTKFLGYMSQLDDYVYRLADINLGLSSFGKHPQSLPSQDTADVPNKDTTPLQNKYEYVTGDMKTPTCLFDMLSEPIRSSEASCMPFTPVNARGHQQGMAIKKNNDWLVDFSSTSSVDSGRKVPAPISEQTEEKQAFSTSPEHSVKNQPVVKEPMSVGPPQTPIKKEIVASKNSLTNASVVENVTVAATNASLVPAVTEPVVVAGTSLQPSNIAVPDLSIIDDTPSKSYRLPQQETLELDRCYHAVITHVDNPSSFFVVVGSVLEFEALYQDMATYYTKHFLSVRNGVGELVAAFIDDLWHRCLVYSVENMEAIGVYMVDMGRMEEVSYHHIQPLVPIFCQKPPYARTCHLVGVEPGPGDWSEEAIQIMKSVHGDMVTILVEENTSESLGVCVILPNKEFLGTVLINKGHAYSNMSNEVPTASGTPLKTAAGETQKDVEPASTPDEDDLEFDDGPEYEDILEAVQGYSNRDEKDICKHYKGPPDTTCFKGLRCKKKHQLIRPDGYTLDKQEVFTGTINEMTFPGPGTNIRVYVVYVATYNSFFAYLYTEDTSDLPPHNRALEELVKEMNSLQMHTSLLPLKLAPAKGEVVIARYPSDGKFYRARVIEEDRDHYRVRYLDFGSTMWLQEKDLRQVCARFLSLPFQAVSCALAGVGIQCETPEAVVDGNKVLTKVLLAKTFDALVVSTLHDSLILTLYDESGFSIADMLATEHHEVFKKVHVGKPKPMEAVNVVPG